MTNMASQATLLGHDVTVLADGSKYYSSKFDKKQKFEIFRFDQLKFLRKKIKFNFANNLIKENKFDKVFFDSWKSLEGFNTEIKLKKICLMHGNEILESSKSNRIASSLKNADGIIFNSIFTKKLFFKNFKKLKNKKHKIIYPAFIIPIKANKLKKRFDLCTVARLEYRKGHHLVLESLNLLKKNHNIELKYAILGNGPELSRLKDLVMKFNLLKNVSFFEENTKSSKIYNLSKIHIMPSITTSNSVEGFGISNVEAAAFGLPSIVSDSGGISESIKNNGIIVKENNLKDLTNAILKVHNNISKFSKNSQKFSTKFDQVRKIKEYLKSF
tara:strand:+ start:11128 stop:12114 length:987 start_codon:yes stop_codon:yes gene_type:complete